MTRSILSIFSIGSVLGAIHLESITGWVAFNNFEDEASCDGIPNFITGIPTGVCLPMFNENGDEVLSYSLQCDEDGCTGGEYSFELETDCAQMESSTYYQSEGVVSITCTDGNFLPLPVGETYAVAKQYDTRKCGSSPLGFTAVLNDNCVNFVDGDGEASSSNVESLHRYTYSEYGCNDSLVTENTELNSNCTAASEPLFLDPFSDLPSLPLITSTMQHLLRRQQAQQQQQQGQQAEQHLRRNAQPGRPFKRRHAPADDGATVDNADTMFKFFDDDFLGGLLDDEQVVEYFDRDDDTLVSYLYNYNNYNFYYYLENDDVFYYVNINDDLYSYITERDDDVLNFQYNDFYQFNGVYGGAPLFTYKYEKWMQIAGVDFPTLVPSRAPTYANTPAPTGSPTSSAPTIAPTAIPSKAPTMPPSEAPTLSVNQDFTIRFTQILDGLSESDYLAHKDSVDKVLTAAIAQELGGGLEADDITIDSVHAALRLRGSLLAVQSDKCNVSYSVHGNTADLGYDNANEAISAMQDSLLTSVSSGDFTAAIQNFASSYDVAVMEAVSSSEITVISSSSSVVADDDATATTSAEEEDSGVSNHWVVGVAVGVGIGVPVIALAVYCSTRKFISRSSVTPS